MSKGNKTTSCDYVILLLPSPYCTTGRKDVKYLVHAATANIQCALLFTCCVEKKYENHLEKNSPLYNICKSWAFHSYIPTDFVIVLLAIQV